MEDEESSNTGSPVGGVHAPTGNPRGPVWAGRVAEGPVVPGKPGNAGGGKGPWVESNAGRKQGMATDANLTGSGRVRKLQTALNVKAKEEPDRRFHALIDKVWREDFLMEAWKQVRRNGGSAGVDGEAIADIEALGVEKWVGELAQDLKDGTYVPKLSCGVLCLRTPGHEDAGWSGRRGVRRLLACHLIARLGGLCWLAEPEPRTIV